MEGVNCRDSDVRVLSVVGLFQFWMFIAGARKPENFLADGDYRGSADAQAEIAALTSAGDGSWPFTVLAATSGIGVHGLCAAVRGRFGSIRRCSQGIGCEVRRTGFEHKA